MSRDKVLQSVKNGIADFDRGDWAEAREAARSACQDSNPNFLARALKFSPFGVVLFLLLYVTRFLTFVAQ